ncbi:MAG TPA: hypothetical protein VK576_04045 [Thermoleophilia bacterium]|nr:hypothetical protein [Thermoleophilia bacterium]
MSGQPGYRSFLLKAGLILALGVVIMACVTGGVVWATGSPTTPAVTQVVGSNNTAGSYGITGYQPIAVKPEAGDVPTFISNPLKEKRGVILLVYVPGSAADEQMVTYFNNVKAKYADRGSFFSFEARKASELGNVLAQLRISQPPALAVISPDGSVYQEYTGWIGQKVMEQVVSNALAK